jgi:hypothetical protein
MPGLIAWTRVGAARQLRQWRNSGIKVMIVNRGRSWTFDRVWLQCTAHKGGV